MSRNTLSPTNARCFLFHPRSLPNAVIKGCDEGSSFATGVWRISSSSLNGLAERRVGSVFSATTHRGLDWTGLIGVQSSQLRQLLRFSAQSSGVGLACVRFDVDGPVTLTSGRAKTLGGDFINCQIKTQQARGGGAIVSNFTALFNYV